MKAKRKKIFDAAFEVFSGPTGRHSIAQGKALGKASRHDEALKGRHREIEKSAALSGLDPNPPFNPGLRPGLWSVGPLGLQKCLPKSFSTLVLTFVVLLTGCKVGPDYHPPQ